MTVLSRLWLSYLTYDCLISPISYVTIVYYLTYLSCDCLISPISVVTTALSHLSQWWLSHLTSHVTIVSPVLVGNIVSYLTYLSCDYSILSHHPTVIPIEIHVVPRSWTMLHPVWSIWLNGGWWCLWPSTQQSVKDDVLLHSWGSNFSMCRF